VAFVATVAMWWLYFDRSARDSSTTIAGSADPGRLGRSAYTYLHLPIVAGVIVSAVADERVIAHPIGRPTVTTAVFVLAGPALFLVGHVLFKRAIFNRLSVSRLIALGVLAASIPVSTLVSPLVLAIVATGVLVGVAVADAVIYGPPVDGGTESG
jgi:low temperature requirement protein LtrA